MEIESTEVARGRLVYAHMCDECHPGGTAGLGGRQLNHDWRRAARDLFADFDLFDLDAMHAVRGSYGESHALADHHFNFWGLEREPLGDDVDDAWLLGLCGRRAAGCAG